jgi:hypothetical protein
MYVFLFCLGIRLFGRKKHRHIFGGPRPIVLSTDTDVNYLPGQSPSPGGGQRIKVADGNDTTTTSIGENYTPTKRPLIDRATPLPPAPDLPVRAPPQPLEPPTPPPVTNALPFLSPIPTPTKAPTTDEPASETTSVGFGRVDLGLPPPAPKKGSEVVGRITVTISRSELVIGAAVVVSVVIGLVVSFWVLNRNLVAARAPPAAGAGHFFVPPNPIPIPQPSIAQSSSARSEQITLTALGLEQAAVLEPGAFVFVVGNMEYPCSRFQAAFLSKTVSNLFFTDPTAAEFVIDEIPDPNHYFRSIWNVLQHGTLEVTQTNVSTLQAFAERLNCEELDRRLCDFQLGGDDLNCQNAVSRLLLKSKRLLPIDNEVEFMASRFDEIESLDRLSPPLLEIVLQSALLRIEREDWLLDLICRLGSEYSFLIRYVRWDSLSSTGNSKLLEMVRVERIDPVLWNSIRSRLQKTSPSSPDSQRSKDRLFRHWSSDFAGLLHYLSEKCRGNVHRNGLVAITASGTGTGHQAVETIANFGQPSNWASNDAVNSWLMFDFKALRVSIEGYSVNSGPTTSWLQRWAMEVWDRKRSWVRIDERSTTELRAPCVTRHFACRSASDEFYRYVRIRQTGPNHNNNHFLAVGNLEFFGRLREP